MTLLSREMYLNPHLSYGQIHNTDQFEVLLTIRAQPRRIAICQHEKDARIIVQAMQEYVNKGGNWV